MEFAAPEGKEEDTDDDEGDAKADPEAEGAPVAAKAEVDPERETDEPVDNEVAEHGSACVACAAEGAGGCSLNAVEELESGSGIQKRDGSVDDCFVVGIEASDHARKDEKRDGHGEHEECAKGNGGVASAGGGVRILAAEGLSNADSGGGRDAQGNHVGEGDGVERDLMAGLGDGPEACDQGGGKGEDADFGGELTSGGNAECEKMTNAAKVDVDGSVEKIGVMAAVVPEEVAEEKSREISAGDCGGDTGAGNAQGRQTELAVDEDPIAGEVDDVGGDEGESDGADHVHPLEGAANGEIEE